jgi:predicted metal-dependent HD superfamily phosphohydrolase
MRPIPGSDLRSTRGCSRAAEQLLAFYDEPHRYYHNREHIREMLDAALKHELKLSAPQTFAVLAHDAVYVPGAQRGDNETLSAQVMRVYAPKVIARMGSASGASCPGLTA